MTNKKEMMAWDCGRFKGQRKDEIEGGVLSMMVAHASE